MKYYAEIDLGGTNIAAGITGENENIIAKYSAKTNAASVFLFGRPFCFHICKLSAFYSNCL